MSTEFEKKKERQRHASQESNGSTESLSNLIPTPPDGGWGWLIVAASMVNHIIVDGIAFTFGVFYLEFLNYFKESKGKTALVGSLLAGVYLCTGPIASALTNKFGCRPVCITGGFISAGAFILCTFSPNIDVLILTYGVIGGFGFGLVYLPSVVSVGYYFEKKRALATGIAVCGAGVGTFMFAPIGRLLLDNYSWQSAMIIISGIVLNSLVCGMLMRPLDAPRQKKKSKRARTKNVLDRLREQAKFNRKHMDSESSNYPGGRDTNTILLGVREAKLARERQLREEDSESEISSIHSSLFYAKRDARSDSVPIPIPGRHPGSFKFARHLSHEYTRSPLSLQSSPPSTMPQIIVEDDDETSKRANGKIPTSDSGSSKLPNGLRDGSVMSSPVNIPSSRIRYDSYQHDVLGSPGEGDVGSIMPESEIGSIAQDGEDLSMMPESEIGSMAPDVMSTGQPEDIMGSGSVVVASQRDPLLGDPEDGYMGSISTLGSKVDNRDPTGSDIMDNAQTGDVALESLPKIVEHEVLESRNGNKALVNSFRIDRKDLKVDIGKTSASVGVLWDKPHTRRRRKKPNQTPSPQVSRADYARPLYRKDIFYSGSIVHIPQFKSQPDMQSYVTSITTIPDVVQPEEESGIWKCLRVPKAAKDTLKEMLDISLLKDPAFMIICLANVFAMAGFYIPYIYITDKAKREIGVETNKAAFLVSIIGITNTVGRVVTGFISDMPCVNPMHVHNVSLMICGISTMLSVLCHNYASLVVYCVTFGLSSAAFISLTTIIVCNLVGLEKLTNAFGLLTLARGISSMAGPPIAGMVFDYSGNYNASFYMGGGVLSVSALLFMSLYLPCFKREKGPLPVEQYPPSPLHP